MWGFRARVPLFQIGQAYSSGTCESGAPEPGYFNNCMPLETYNEELAGAWQLAGTRAPGYFGLPASDLEDIGQAIAADPRFALCSARRFYSFLTQTPEEDVPFETIASLQEEFLSTNYNAKQLAKSVVLSDAFMALSLIHI